MDRLPTTETFREQPIRAPRGQAISCKGWQQEAALRMFMNSLDPEVADASLNLTVSGRPGKTAPNPEFFQAIVSSLRSLENDETLLVQSGRTAGIFRTHAYAPRVLIATKSWMHIGSQAILQDTYEVFAAAGKKHFRGDLSGKLIASGGMGCMGGAQPLAATLNGASFLGIDADPEQIKRRVKAGYCDVMVNDLDEALRILKNAVRTREAVSVGLVGNCADVIPTLARRGVVPDLLTDQTSAHDPIGGYIPQGLDIVQAAELREKDPEAYRRRALESVARHAEGLLALQKLGSVAFEYGNHICAVAREQGVANAFDIPDFAAAYVRPLLSEGQGPLRWVALSGEPADIHRTDKLVLEMFPDNQVLSRWIRSARTRVRLQGLPARASWLGYGEREKFGLAVNGLVASGELKAPIAIGCDHLDCGSVAFPGRETDAMPTSSNAAAGWAFLSAMLNAASGATWVSIHNGSGDCRGDCRENGRGNGLGAEGPGGSPFAGLAVVADGTEEMAIRLERALGNDSRIGVLRQADAGYPEAIAFARKSGIAISTDRTPGQTDQIPD